MRHGHSEARRHFRPRPIIEDTYCFRPGCWREKNDTDLDGSIQWPLMALLNHFTFPIAMSKISSLKMVRSDDVARREISSQT